MSSADAAYTPDTRAVEAMRQSLRVQAPERFAAASKVVGVLQKLLRNPADQPEEPRFRKLKLTNATVARVLATTGVREVLEACGFSADAEHLELRMEATDTAAVARLSSAAEAVEAAQRMLQELHWIATVRNEVPSLAARPWAADGAAHALVQACLAAVSAPASDPLALAAKIPWVRRLNRLMFSAELQECRSSLSPLASVAIVALQTTSLELIRVGARDVRSLVEVSQCLAQLWPPGEARTLDARLDFAFACMEAALPPAGEPLELRLRLVRRELLGSAIEALGAFSEMGVRCGVLKQPLTIEYVGEAGQDAGGLRRQFFDLFTAELPASRLWTHTDAGGLRPEDRAALSAEAAAQLRPHMEACGRVCGMALYQELHRRLGVRWEPEVFAGQPPSLLGDSFARYFLRAVRHDPPATLAELQAELRAECPDSAPDYRAGPEILSRSLRESGLEGQTFVRHVGGAEVPLVEGGAVRAVCDESKAEWLERMLRAELVDGVAAAAAHFRKGLVDAISPGHIDAADALTCRWTTPHFFLLTADELQAQWSGAAVSRSFVASCRATATVHPEVAQQAQWLWEVLDELDDAERARWFRFLTGSSRGPRGGTNLRIGPRAGGDGAFPFAHACVSSLDLPSYSSRELLRERLGAAVKAAHDKFTDL